MILFLWACSDYALQGKGNGNGDGISDPSEVMPTDHPNIVVQPTPIAFDNTLKDCSSEPVVVTVTNRGHEELSVTDIQFTGDVSSSFSHTGSAFELAFDEQITFEAHFHPQLYRDFEVGLQFESNDPVHAKLTVPTLGSGVSGALYEQSYVQEGYSQVDVLWVIDNSRSMSESIAKVEDNFSVFLGQFQNLQLDYQMAIITTDMSEAAESGRIQGSIITQNTPQNTALSTFIQSVGFGGSGDEMGFEATQKALSAPLINSENTGFLRSNASLSVIVISDEDDSSVMDAPAFVTWLLSLKSDPNQIRFNGFVGLSLGSNSPGCSITSVGTKYIEAAARTQGFAIDLCISNYDTALQELSSAAAGLRVHFPLDEEPASLASIVVEVNGERVEQGLDGWTYNIDENAIVFHGDTIPQPGANVYFSYEASMICE